MDPHADAKKIAEEAAAIDPAAMAAYATTIADAAEESEPEKPIMF